MSSRQISASTLTRREIIDHLRRRLGLSGREAGLLLDGFLEAVAEQLADGGAVSLSGLGRFEIRPTPPRPGRNPATGREVMIPGRLRPVFTLSRGLRTILKAAKQPSPDPDIAPPGNDSEIAHQSDDETPEHRRLDRPGL